MDQLNLKDQKCCFLLAEEQKKSRKNFSHTHLGAWVQVCEGLSHMVGCNLSVFGCCLLLPDPLLFKLSSFNHLNVIKFSLQCNAAFVAKGPQ